MIEGEGVLFEIGGNEFEIIVDEGAFSDEVKGDGRGSCGELFFEEGLQALAIDGFEEGVVRESKEVSQGGEDVHGGRGIPREAWLDFGGPLDDGGDADAAFPEV